jgi:hypothetical protein
MAGKTRDRKELRRQYEAAEPVDPMEDDAEDTGEAVAEVEEEPRPKKKPKAPVKKAKSSKLAKPAARMRIVWQVVSDAFKPVATFAYNQKPAADARAAELTAKGKGTHFVQKVKEAMPDDAPGLGATIPRAEVAPAPPKRKGKAVKPEELIEEEEEIEEEEPEEEEEEEED